MDQSEAIRAALASAAILLIPGRAAFRALGLERYFGGLQGWLVALGMGAALPVLLFALQDSLVSVGVPIGGLGTGLARGLIGIAALFLLERRWRGDAQAHLDRNEWFALGIILLVAFPRVWLAASFPVPPLTDSLHHALLTREVVTSGFLPDQMPVFPSIALDRYHMGLYAISAFVSWVGAVSPISGLIWAGQSLNLLAAIGVYVILDRFVSRKAAWLGLLAAGLIDQMPNVYFAWGRFTQIGGQAILPLAWLVSWIWLQQLHRNVEERGGQVAWPLGVVAIGLSVATVLVHLRVGIFLCAILATTFLAECLVARRDGRLRALLVPASLTACLGFLALLPRYGTGLYHWVWGHWFLSLDGNGWTGGSDLRGINSDAYFSVWTTESVFAWTAPPLLVFLAIALGLFAVIQGDRLARVTACWSGLLLALGSVHLLRIHVLDILPLNSVFLFSYFPLAILLGVGVNALALSAPADRTDGVEKIAVISALILALVSLPARLADVPPEYNLVEAGDRKAFDWIEKNTPPRAQFAIAAYNLLPSLAVGTDGGYWIPYFTGRRTTTGPMLSPLSPRLMTRSSRLVTVQKLPGFGSEKVDRLVSQGVSYFYLSRSAQGVVDGRKLARPPQVELVYDHDGVQILELSPSRQLVNAARILRRHAEQTDAVNAASPMNSPRTSGRPGLAEISEPPGVLGVQP